MIQSYLPRGRRRFIEYFPLPKTVVVGSTVSWFSPRIIIVYYRRKYLGKKYMKISSYFKHSFCRRRCTLIIITTIIILCWTHFFLFVTRACHGYIFSGRTTMTLVIGHRDVTRHNIYVIILYEWVITRNIFQDSVIFF